MSVRAILSRPAYFPLLALSVLVLTAGVHLAIREPQLFAPYFSIVLPPIAIPAAYLNGWPALIHLSERSYFTLNSLQKWQRSLRFTTLHALGFAVSVTIADLVLRFPRDINVSLPAVLIFYPVMAYVVALVAHAIPLAFLMALAQTSFQAMGYEYPDLALYRDRRLPRSRFSACDDERRTRSSPPSC